MMAQQMKPVRMCRGAQQPPLAAPRAVAVAPVGWRLFAAGQGARRAVVCGGMAGGAPGAGPSFLSMEEATLVDWAPIDMHEKFLARLTISSLNLLKMIAEEEGCSVEELNAGLITDWFTKDNQRRVEDPESAVLKWEATPSIADLADLGGL